jgi:hypothetical protein
MAFVQAAVDTCLLAFADPALSTAELDATYTFMGPCCPAVVALVEPGLLLLISFPPLLHDLVVDLTVH